MISPDGIGDLESAAEEEKRYCQSELEKLDERRRQVLIDLGAAVAEHEKGNPAFWADYPAESKALSDVEDNWMCLKRGSQMRTRRSSRRTTGRKAIR